MVRLSIQGQLIQEKLERSGRGTENGGQSKEAQKGTERGGKGGREKKKSSRITRQLLSFLQLLFAATMLHAHMCTSQNPREMAAAADVCDQAWASMTSSEREAYAGLSVYHRLLRAAHWLSMAEYSKVKPHLNGGLL